MLLTTILKVVSATRTNMEQVLILEAHEKAFLEEMDKKLKEGFKVIAGSTLIKSLPTNIELDHGTMTTDVEHVFTMAITGRMDFMVLAKTKSSFKDEVNAKIKQPAFQSVTGSVSIDIVRKSEYKDSSRIYITYYCCTLYKG